MLPTPEIHKKPFFQRPIFVVPSFVEVLRIPYQTIHKINQLYSLLHDDIDSIATDEPCLVDDPANVRYDLLNALLPASRPKSAYRVEHEGSC
mgnify:CR=1 FL=1